MADNTEDVDCVDQEVESMAPLPERWRITGSGEAMHTVGHVQAL